MAQRASHAAHLCPSLSTSSSPWCVCHSQVTVNWSAACVQPFVHPAASSPGPHPGLSHLIPPPPPLSASFSVFVFRDLGRTSIPSPRLSDVFCDEADVWLLGRCWGLGFHAFSSHQIRGTYC